MAPLSSKCCICGKFTVLRGRDTAWHRQSHCWGKEKPIQTPGREIMPNLADITNKHLQSTTDTNANEEFMKVKMSIRQTLVSRNSESSTRTNHSSWPLAALACYQPAGRDIRPKACTSRKEQNWSVCAFPKRRWLWQQCGAAKTLNLCSSNASAGWS